GMTGMLVLEDGTVFRGESVGAEGFAFGEAVFTTAMTGYQEVVTDPSYAEQVVVFSAPMVGNYGVASGRCESARPHARAVVMREARGPAWTDWLHEHGLVALSGIDTRSLVVHLRQAGAMRAIAVSGEASVDEALAAVREQPAMAGRARAPRRGAGLRHLPRPPAARARNRPRDLQAPVRPPRRQPPGARQAHEPRAGDEPEPRLRGRALHGARGDARLPLRRHGRGARL